MISPKIFMMSHHQHKGNAFQQALRARGWHECHYIKSRNVKFGLFDADWRQGDIDKLNGAPYFLYPHAARPMVQYDGSVTPKKDVRAMFVSAPAGVYLMDKIGYPNEVIEVGWSLTPIKHFFPRAMAQEIVFAPIHPNANGYLNAVDKNLNKAVYDRLVTYANQHDAHITVRYCRTLSGNGLEEEWTKHDECVTWLQGFTDGSTTQILNADLVVAHQTYAYMAVALGVPTVMMGEDIAPRSGNSEQGFSYSVHFEEYKDYLMFPLDILNGDPEKIIDTAISTDEPIRDWRDRFIGHAFEPDYFVDCIEGRI